MGVLYCLMSMGINFIYGIMKVINWSMGEFFMIGAFIQYLLLTTFLGGRLWFVGVILSAIAVFFLGEMHGSHRPHLAEGNHHQHEPGKPEARDQGERERASQPQQEEQTRNPHDASSPSVLSVYVFLPGP